MSTATATPATKIAFRVPSTMRAAVYYGVNDVRVETIPVPAIGVGEILIQVACCGICGTDLKKIHAGSHPGPRIFGHETTGTICAIGEGVEDFAVGDRVMVFHHIPCGHCYYCRKQTYAQCEVYKRVGVTAGYEPAGGGFAGYVRVMDWIVRDGGVVRIPDGVPFEQAAFVEPVNTCLKGVKMLNLQPDETVLVIGQGPIGILLAILAQRTGATVYTSDLYPERHAIAQSYGLRHPIDAREDVAQVLRDATGGRGADAVLLAVGHNALIESAMDAVRPGGKVQLFAQTQHGEASFDPAAVCMDEKTLLGSYSASVDIQREGAELVFNGYAHGFDLTRLISHRFSLEQAVEAIDIASHPTASSMKIMIVPEQSQELDK